MNGSIPLMRFVQLSHVWVLNGKWYAANSIKVVPEGRNSKPQNLDL